MEQQYVVMGKTIDDKGKEREFKPLKVEADSEEQAIAKALAVRYADKAALHSTEDLLAMAGDEMEFVLEIVEGMGRKGFKVGGRIKA